MSTKEMKKYSHNMSMDLFMTTREDGLPFNSGRKVKRSTS